MRIRMENLPVKTSLLNCIKAYRMAFNCGLKDAKDAIEAVRDAGQDCVEGDTEQSIDAIRVYVCTTGQNANGWYNCGLTQVKIVPVAVPADIESKGMQVFNVPNDDAGKAFMAQLSAYLNRPQYTISKRGRGSRKEHGEQSHVPLPHAEWIAVYIQGGKIDRVRRDMNIEHNATVRATNDAQRLAEVQRDHAKTAEALRDTTAEVNALRKELQTAKQTVPVKAVKASLPKIVLPLSDGSKVQVIGATEIKVAE